MGEVQAIKFPVKTITLATVNSAAAHFNSVYSNSVEICFLRISLITMSPFSGFLIRIDQTSFYTISKFTHDFFRPNLSYLYITFPLTTLLL